MFPVRHELNVYVPSRRYSVFKGLTLETKTVKQESEETFADYLMFILTVWKGRIPWYLGSKWAHSFQLWTLYGRMEHGRNNNWQGKPELLREKHVLVLLYAPQIPHWLP
jgi:hypothetical protein